LLLLIRGWIPWLLLGHASLLLVRAIMVGSWKRSRNRSNRRSTLLLLRRRCVLTRWHGEGWGSLIVRHGDSYSYALQSKTGCK
jgi:hypothetical protein